MDWFRQVPIGQFVVGNSSWLRRIDPRLKFSWVLMFLLTPILSGPTWRISLVISLIIITLFSSLAWRVWWRSICLLFVFAFFVGTLSIFLPSSEASAIIAIRSPDELKGIEIVAPTWNILEIGPFNLGNFSFGPLMINRRSAELGIKTSTLIFTVIHSVNLMLLTTPPEDLMWSLRWFLSPLALIGLPIDRISFQLLLALRFLPLVQEELQNLMRSLSSRAINFKRLGMKASLNLVLSVGERLLANILLRAEQGSEALLARGGFWLNSNSFKPKNLFDQNFSLLNIGSVIVLLVVLGLRGKYGDL